MSSLHNKNGIAKGAGAGFVEHNWGTHRHTDNHLQMDVYEVAQKLKILNERELWNCVCGGKRLS